MSPAGSSLTARLLDDARAAHAAPAPAAARAARAPAARPAVRVDRSQPARREGGRAAGLQAAQAGAVQDPAILDRLDLGECEQSARPPEEAPAEWRARAGRPRGPGPPAP